LIDDLKAVKTNGALPVILLRWFLDSNFKVIDSVRKSAKHYDTAEMNLDETHCVIEPGG